MGDGVGFGGSKIEMFVKGDVLVIVVDSEIDHSKDLGKGRSQLLQSAHQHEIGDERQFQNLKHKHYVQKTNQLKTLIITFSDYKCLETKNNFLIDV